ncbi:nephrin-like isoform X2 [Limulus polyphemus]|uniref:Nephrin-like isoform X2 n=1 Tax=Limulus polyphemus TaxID=6850 RepID=A0ABM1T938_LIMPO|nr:nephrin-like isoform X2 [Limulus polyphemus]
MKLWSPVLHLSRHIPSRRDYQSKHCVFDVIILLLTLITAVSSDIPVFQTVLGQRAELFCNVSVPSVDDSVSLVLWYKSGISAPIFSVDSRNGPIESSEHFTSEFLGKRGHFYPGTRTQPSVLTINPVEKVDDGEYRCRTDFRYGRTFNRVVSLNVIVPPEDVTIVDEFNRPVQRYTSPHNEGSKLILGCIAKGGKPPPSVTWWRNSVLIDNSFRKTHDLQVRNDYVFQQLRREDLMTRLTCQASNNNITSPRIAHVIIDINLKPTEVFITSKHHHVSANRRFGIECQTTGSRPAAHITWWLGNLKIETAMEAITDGGNRTVSNLIYSPSTEDNGKYLSCRAENQHLPEETLEDGITLNVFFSVTLRRGQEAKQIQTGDDVHLQCQYKSNPEVLKIKWQFQSDTLKTNIRTGIFVRNQSLIMKNVTKEQSGTYRCFAENREGRGYSEGLEIVVKYAPVCKKGQKIAYAVTVNELVEVSCEVESDPDDVIFIWTINNTMGSRELLTFTTSGLKSFARYIPREENDFGFLACQAQNQIGAQVDPCIFTLIPVGPPSPPYNCSISNSTNSTLLVECSPGVDGGLQQIFHVEVFLLPRRQLQANLSNFNHPLFLLSTLPSEAHLLLSIYSSNNNGRSAMVTLTAHTVASLSTKPRGVYSTRLRPLLGILLGIVGTFVLMSTIFVLIFRRKRAGKQQNKAKEYDQRRNEKCVSAALSEGVISSDPDLISLKNSSPISTFLHLQKRSNDNVRIPFEHADRYLLRPTSGGQYELSLNHFNVNDSYEYLHPHASYQESKEWAKLSLDHRPEDNLELNYVVNARWEQADNDIQTQYERLGSSKSSCKVLQGQIYPVRDYRRYTPV